MGNDNFGFNFPPEEPLGVLKFDIFENAGEEDELQENYNEEEVVLKEKEEEQKNEENEKEEKEEKEENEENEEKGDSVEGNEKEEEEKEEEEEEEEERKMQVEMEVLGQLDILGIQHEKEQQQKRTELEQQQEGTELEQQQEGTELEQQQERTELEQPQPLEMELNETEHLLETPMVQQRPHQQMEPH